MLYSELSSLNPKTMRQYIILRRDHPDALAEEVTNKLQDGWKLYGELIVETSCKLGTQFNQVMVRPKEIPVCPDARKIAKKKCADDIGIELTIIMLLIALTFYFEFSVVFDGWQGRAIWYTLAISALVKMISVITRDIKCFKELK